MQSAGDPTPHSTTPIHRFTGNTVCLSSAASPIELRRRLSDPRPPELGFHRKPGVPLSSRRKLSPLSEPSISTIPAAFTGNTVSPTVSRERPLSSSPPKTAKAGESTTRSTQVNTPNSWSIDCWGPLPRPPSRLSPETRCLCRVETRHRRDSWHPRTRRHRRDRRHH